MPIKVYPGGAKSNVKNVYVYPGGARTKVKRAYAYPNGQRTPIFAGVELQNFSMAAGLGGTLVQRGFSRTEPYGSVVPTFPTCPGGTLTYFYTWFLTSISRFRMSYTCPDPGGEPGWFDAIRIVGPTSWVIPKTDMTYIYTGGTCQWDVTNITFPAFIDGQAYTVTFE